MKKQTKRLNSNVALGATFTHYNALMKSEQGGGGNGIRA